MCVVLRSRQAQLGWHMQDSHSTTGVCCWHHQQPQGPRQGQQAGRQVAHFSHAPLRNLFAWKTLAPRSYHLISSVT